MKTIKAPTLSNTALRLLSILVLVPLVIGLYILGGFFWLGLLAVSVGFLTYEWLKLIQNTLAPAHAVMTAAFFGICILTPTIPNYAILALGLPAIVGQKNHKLLAAMTGPYIVFPIFCLFVIGLISSTALLWLAAIVWLTDTCALIAGKTFGGKKLAPTLSPNKTWSGLLGGVLGALMVTGLFMVFTEVPTHLYGWAAFISIIGQCGDLFESKFKRQFDVKDSGTLIPGHGGILDRMDSFLFAAPTLWACLALGLITF